MPDFPEVGLSVILDGVSKFNADAKSVSGTVTSLGDTVLKVGGIAAGVALGGITALGAGIVGLGMSAMGPIGDFERMSASLSSLVAREVQAADSTLSFDEALAKAGPQTKELIGWVEQLAIISPFESKDVATAMQMAMSFGMTTDEAKKLVSAEINFAAATGKGGEAMQRVSMALGKVNTSGKVGGEVLMQLAEAGVPAAKILSEMGYSAEDASKGLVPADKFIQAVIDDFNKFGSAAQAQANTWPGLLSSLEDLKKIALREFFTGTFEAIKPYVVDFVTMLQDPGVRKWLKETGDLIGKTIAGGLEKVIAWVKQAGEDFAYLSQWVGDILEGNWDALGDIPWEDFLPDWLADSVYWLIKNLPLVKGALEGIAAVLAGAAVAAAIAGIGAAVLALANPVTLLIAAGAALGVAWETNWMGMRDTLTAFWNDTAKPALDELYVWLQKELPIALAALADFWYSTLLPALSDLADWLKVNVPKAATALVKFWNTKLIPALSNFSDWMNDVGIPAAQAFVKWLDTKLIPVLKDMEKSLGKVQKALADTGKEMDREGGTFSKLADLWAKHGDSIKKTTTDVFNYIVSQIESKLKIAQDVVAIAADVISGDWESAWERMRSLQENITNTMTLGLSRWANDIGKMLGTRMVEIARDWQENWGTMLSRTSSTIGNWLNKTASDIAGFASSLYNAAVTMMRGLIDGVANQASAFASRLLSVVSEAIGNLLSSVSGGSLASTLRSVGQTIISMIQAGIAAVTGLASSLINAVASAVSSLVSSVVGGGIGSALSSVGQTIMSLISAAVSTVTSLASALVNSVASAVANLINSIASGALFNTLRAVGGAIIDGLVRGIQNNASDVADALSDIVNDAIQAIKNELGIPGDPGPSRYMAAVGAALMRGYAQGILSQAGSVTNAMQMAIAGAQGMGGLTLAPSLVTGPGLSSGGGGSTTINNFHVGGNNITSGMDQAVFEARVLQVIRKNLR